MSATLGVWTRFDGLVSGTGLLNSRSSVVQFLYNIIHTYTICLQSSAHVVVVLCVVFCLFWKRGSSQWSNFLDVCVFGIRSYNILIAHICF
jgi:hypothetical protein